MIIKLHGTSGSGKTTVAQALRSKASEDILRDQFHELIIPGLDLPVFLLGRYDKTVCGGMDTIQSPQEQIDLMMGAASDGHVFYEGLLLSGFYGRIGKASENYGDDHVFGFLTTPLEVCVQRVKDRRAKRGTQTEFNDANTRDKYDAILRLKYRLDNELHRHTEWISWKSPVDAILTILKGDPYEYQLRNAEVLQPLGSGAGSGTGEEGGGQASTVDS